MHYSRRRLAETGWGHTYPLCLAVMGSEGMYRRERLKDFGKRGGVKGKGTCVDLQLGRKLFECMQVGF